jgi:Predicted site-specific integrase-resolvase
MALYVIHSAWNGVCSHNSFSAKYYRSSKGGQVQVDRDCIYTLAEVAEGLGLSLRTLQRYVSAGEVPVRRLGRRVYVLGSDLLEGLPRGAPAEAGKRRTRRRKAKAEDQAS